MLLCAAGSKVHRETIIRADHLPNALAVPYVRVGRRQYLVAAICVLISPLLAIFIFVVEQVGKAVVLRAYLWLRFL
jgi:hypothetical protein